jgi:hypothetical protein
VLLLGTLALPLPAWSEQSRVGVVAMLLGTATVSRTALPAPSTLRFKDDVFLHDRITTAERSAVRVLLGGKATVTARERSTLTITETVATATVFLAAGRTAVAVSNAVMKPGETVEIRTTNSVVAIRGTLVIADVAPPRSTITIVRGLVAVTKLDPATGKPVGPAVKVGALERVIVTDAGPVSAPESITAEAARRLASDFLFVPQNAPAASLEGLTQAVKDASLSDVTSALVGPGGVRGTIRSPVSGATSTATTTATVTGAVSAVGSLGGSVRSGATGNLPSILTRPGALSGPVVLPGPTPLTPTTPPGSIGLPGPITPRAPTSLTGPITNQVTNSLPPNILPTR